MPHPKTADGHVISWWSGFYHVRLGVGWGWIQFFCKQLLSNYPTERFWVIRICDKYVLRTCINQELYWKGDKCFKLRDAMLFFTSQYCTLELFFLLFSFNIHKNCIIYLFTSSSKGDNSKIGKIDCSKLYGC